MVRHAMHRQVLILAAAQDLFQTASVLVGTVGSLAGALLEAVGWQRLNLLVLPWLALATLALGWFGYQRQRDGASESVSMSH